MAAKKAEKKKKGQKPRLPTAKKPGKIETPANLYTRKTKHKKKEEERNENING